MTSVFLRASLALWKRREASREVKYRHAAVMTPKGSPERHKYHQLLVEARTMVAKRTKQLAARQVKRVGPDGVRLIKSFEGFTANGHPYLDTVADPPVWTIGYGHVEGVHANSKPLTERQASRLLQRDLDRKYAPYVAALKLPLNQHQFDALVSAVYNLGPGVIGLDSHVGMALRKHDWESAADHLLDWDRAGGQKIPGLTRRRKAERTLFLTGRLTLN